jgi:hypothetical protein
VAMNWRTERTATAKHTAESSHQQNTEKKKMTFGTENDFPEKLEFSCHKIILAPAFFFLLFHHIFVVNLAFHDE